MPTVKEEAMRPKLVRDLIFNIPISSFADAVAEEKDLIVIGGGVAGYVAAIKASQEGLKVILFNFLYNHNAHHV